MLKVLRIDDRLLHGQVAFSWSNVLSIDTIYIVNDEIAKDEITKMTLGIAKPRGTTLSCLPLDTGISKIKERLKDRSSLMVIVNNVKDACTIVKAVPEIKSVNFGGIKEKKDIPSKRFTGSVTVTLEELEYCKEMAQMGIELEIRQVPEDKKNLINNLL